MITVVRDGQLFNSGEISLDRADILIDGDRIVEVGCNLSAPADARTIEADGCIVLPGLVNAHTHAHNNLVKGMGDNWTQEVQRSHGFALYGNTDPEDHYLAAAIGAIEMLKTGCTASYDLCFAGSALDEELVEAVVRAYSDVGLRAVIAPSLTNVAYHHMIPGLIDALPPDLLKTVRGMKPPSIPDLLRYVESTIRRWNGVAAGRIRIGVAPTIPGQCSDDFLTACVHLTRDYGVGLHTHLVETKAQAVHAQNRWGKTVVARLAELGALDARFVGAHGVWLTEGDIQQLGDAGAAIAHNPASNLKLGSGIAPVREMLDHGVNVALGCDGSLSSDNQNMFESMRLAALVSKVRFPNMPSRWVGASDAWEMATKGSARALGLGESIGAIAPGYMADLVLLRADSAFLVPMNHVVNALVYAETGADVDTVLVNGRVVLDHGRVLAVDESYLRSRAQKAADRLHRQNHAAWNLAERLAPHVITACEPAVASSFPVNRYALSASCHLTAEE